MARDIIRSNVIQIKISVEQVDIYTPWK